MLGVMPIDIGLGVVVARALARGVMEIGEGRHHEPYAATSERSDNGGEDEVLSTERG